MTTKTTTPHTENAILNGEGLNALPISFVFRSIRIFLKRQAYLTSRGD